MVNGNKIKELIEKQGKSLRGIAPSVGVSESMMSYIVNGLKEPSVAVLVRIAKELGCSVDDLIKEGD
jgi:transcriptional regulator with XRE-family HTH domain